MDKAPGPTSHDVVETVRRSVGVRRVGHAGTLDPFASGLLLVLVGRATRLARFVATFPKRYTGRMRLGESRDTDDSTGRVISACEVGESVTDTVVRDAMRALTGRVPQRPPAFSAVKVDGERAYQGARRGRAPVLMPREVEVARFDLVRREGPDVWFAVEVSGGTYVRALARDVGAAIGCGAHLAALRRVSIGPFTVDDAWAPAKGGGPPPQRPPSDLVRHLPALGLDAAARDAVAHGRSIPCDTPVEGPVALFAADTLVAIAEPADAVLKPRVVLVDD